MAKLNLDGKYIEFIKNTVNTLLPDVDIYVFGSRVQEKSLKYSDVDIALKGVGVLDFNQVITLRAVFADSSFPYKVDIIDLNNIDDNFYNIIKNDLYKI